MSRSPVLNLRISSSNSEISNVVSPSILHHHAYQIERRTALHTSVIIHTKSTSNSTDTKNPPYGINHEKFAQKFSFLVHSGNSKSFKSQAVAKTDSSNPSCTRLIRQGFCRITPRLLCKSTVTKTSEENTEYMATSKEQKIYFRNENQPF